MAVNPQVLASGDGAGAVIPVQRDVRRAVQAAERFAKRLDRTFKAVLQLEQAAQIQVNSSASEPPGGWSLKPFKIDKNLSCGSCSLLEAEGLPCRLSTMVSGFKGEAEGAEGAAGAAGGNESTGLGRDRSSGRTKGSCGQVRLFWKLEQRAGCP